MPGSEIPEVRAAVNFLADSEGVPLIAYHGTRVEISEFAPLSHFGTLTAAQDRLEYTRTARGIDGERVGAYLLAIQNPAWLYEDPGLCNPGDVTGLAVDSTGRKLFSAVEAANVGLDVGKLVAAMAAKGYDGLYYRNEAEDPGSFTYVNFHPEQVVPLR